MTWQCRLIDSPEQDEHGNVDLSKREIGDMWFLDLPESELRERHLSDYFWANNSSRKPLIVVLPRKTYFYIDGMCYNNERGYYDGWTVTGAPPLITVHQSINLEGAYHGFLQNGVIGDPL